MAVIGKIVTVLVLAVVFIAVSGLVCQTLWNFVVPEIFGLATISFWQALGLMALSSCFFYRGNSSSSKS